MIGRKCERSAHPEQDSIPHARSLARWDLGLPLARDHDDVKYDYHCYLRWPGRHHRHRLYQRDCPVGRGARQSINREG